jgi:hypothetical protein
MPKHASKKGVSPETRDEAMKIARGTQRPGQTKEQTRLIAQGIQKGIDQYKKQQKSKARELDKRLKKVRSEGATETSESEVEQPQSCSKLPWILLGISWMGFVLFFALGV